MTRCLARWLSVLSLAYVVLPLRAAWASPGATPTTPGNCGPPSLFELCELLGYDLEWPLRERLLRTLPAPACSMLDIRDAARTVGVQLLGVKASLSELRALPGPMIVHLTGPQHFLVLARTSSSYVQVHSDRLETWTWGQLGERYDGMALVLPPDVLEVGGPRIGLEAFHHDRGTVREGEELSFGFSITNQGDETLVLNPSAATCSSATAAVDHRAVAPGGVATVTIRLAVRSPGRSSAVAKLMTNDPVNPILYLTLACYATPQIRCIPARAWLVAEKGHAAVASVELSGPEQMEVLGTECEADGVSVVASEPVVDDKGVKRCALAISVDGARVLGEFRCDVKARVADERKQEREVVIPVEGRILTDLCPYPPTAFFGLVRQGEEVPPREVTIRATSGSSFRVLGWSADLSGVSVVSRPVVSGYCLTVRLTPDQPGVLKGVIAVATDMPREETVRIPVYAHVVGRAD